MRLRRRPPATSSERFGDAPTAGTAHGLPDVLALGSIPFFTDLHDRQEGDPGYEYRRSEFEVGRPAGRLSGHAFCRLFATGNLDRDVARAQAHLDDRGPRWHEGLGATWVRAALCLSDLRIHLDGNVLTGLTGLATWRVGATPTGIGALKPGFRRKGPRMPHGGTSRLGGQWAATKSPTYGRDEEGRAYAEQGLRFRIGTTADWAGRVLTGYPAPWVWAVARFTVLPPGDGPLGIELSWRQSAIPTTRWELDRRGWGPGNDMLAIGEHDLRSFMHSGAGKGTAPAGAAGVVGVVDL